MNKKRICKYEISVPITVTFNSSSETESNVLRITAEKFLDFFLKNGQAVIDTKEIDIKRVTPLYSVEELESIKRDDEELGWAKFRRNIRRV